MVQIYNGFNGDSATFVTHPNLFFKANISHHFRFSLMEWTFI